MVRNAQTEHECEAGWVGWPGFAVQDWEDVGQKLKGDCEGRRSDWLWMQIERRNASLGGLER